MEKQLRPTDLATDETVRFLSGVLPPPPRRILDAGSGEGGLAARLVAQGYEVTALDRSTDAGTLAKEAGVRTTQADFLDCRDGPYDVVVFSCSLHHIWPLEAAVMRAHDLLKPGGLLIAEEFRREQADTETARWYFEMRSLIEAMEGGSPEHSTPLPADPLAEWHAIHAHIEEHPLHTGDAMLDAIQARFKLIEHQACPYLYRNLNESLEATERGCRVAKRILEIEKARTDQGSLVAIGLRIVARREA